MKQLLAIFTAALLWVPGLALAAYNDVLLETSGTVISVGGVSLNITGYASDLESIKTETDTFTVTLGSGSRFQVTSNDGYVMTHDAANALVQTDSCSGGVSTLEFVGTGSVTITTTTTECSGNASQSSPIGSGGVVSSGGGGGGGGGGSSSATVSRPQVSFPDGTVIYLDEADANAKIAAKNAELGITKTAATTKTVATTPSGTEVSVPVIATLFSRALDLGDKNSEVLDLQKLLNSDPDTQIAPNGVGSPGNETNFFGNLTKKAVEKFQVKYSIAGPGDSGYGFVGPKT
ncbi:MAG: hypothetical protein Q8P93_04745, partial [bacterium]|nr:hypothetical protein [bacterium]